MKQSAGDLSEPAIPRNRTASDGWRVLVVEGSDTSGALVNRLRGCSHDVELVRTGRAALHAHSRADLLLVDLELPDLDGVEVCRSIRSTSDIPIIAVTRRGSERDRVLGLQAGADDYVVKPYGFRELAARMDAVMRRVARQSSAIAISLGGLTIDPCSREVHLGDRHVEVTRKEFDLLHLLASHPGTVISRKQLMQRVWGGSWSRRTVDTHVNSLRNKLGNSSWIVTVRGVGFRFGGV
ncbi:response regulator transcription factor [Streptomyces sp. NPDC059639]|uniref:response regulator transcription factor n=1 Tax=Streptomyces sp. NPDC059639 TaxID=3346891 RepID=UPI0036C545A3